MTKRHLVPLAIVALVSVLTLEVAAICGVFCDCFMVVPYLEDERQYFIDQDSEYSGWSLYRYPPTIRANCTGQNLTDLPMGIHQHVGLIHLGYNNINHLKKNTFTKTEFFKLKILYLNDNSITTIEEGAFNGLESVRKLVLSGNNITYLPSHIFDNMTFLDYLSLDRNNVILPDAIFRELTFLTVLKLSHCNLTALPLEVYSMKFKELDISYNNLENLSLNFTVQNLNISNNNNNIIHFINSTNLDSLEMLDLSNNSLNIPDNFHIQVPNLVRLYLTSCKLNDKDVNGLLNNETTSISSKLQLLNNLEYIFLEYNNISSLPINIFAHNQQLSGINLSNNHINFPENSIFLNSSALEILILRWNAITKVSEITFSGTPNLRRLELDNNYLETIDSNAFHELHKLYFVSLSGNRIKKLDEDLFVNNIQLEILSLANNPLDIPKKSSILNAPNLKSIGLNQCNLSEIPSKLFSHMPRLYFILLSNNSLSTVDWKAFEILKFLGKVDIKGNPLICDGRLKQLLHFFLKKDIEIRPAECVFPKGDWRMLEHMHFDLDSPKTELPSQAMELNESFTTSEVLKNSLAAPVDGLSSRLGTPDKLLNSGMAVPEKISKSGLSKPIMFALLVIGVLTGVAMGLAIDVFIFRRYQCFSRYQAPTEQT